MPKFVIEREIPGIGQWPAERLQAAGKSSEVLRELGPQIQWLHSYATGDKLHCIYIAPDRKLIETHASRGGFPANRVSEITAIIDPTTGER